MDASAWDDRYRAAGLVWTADANQLVIEVCSSLAPGRAEAHRSDAAGRIDNP
jgi:hypothetical protein